MSIDQDATPHLTGYGKTGNYPESVGSAGSGSKFTPDGEPAFFPGNTFICHIDPESPEHAAICDLQSGLKAAPTGQYFTFLPASSLHMTVFPGLCGDPLGHDGWPEGIEKEMTLADITAEFQHRLCGKTAFSSTTIEPIALRNGYSLSVDGVTHSDREKIRRARDMLEDVTGIRRPDFRHYQLHISLCYQTRWMDNPSAESHMRSANDLFNKFCERVSQIKLGPIEFCQFSTMHAFERVHVIPSKHHN